MNRKEILALGTFTASAATLLWYVEDQVSFYLLAASTTLAAAAFAHTPTRNTLYLLFAPATQTFSSRDAYFRTQLKEVDLPPLPPSPPKFKSYTISDDNILQFQNDGKMGDDDLKTACDAIKTQGIEQALIRLEGILVEMEGPRGELTIAKVTHVGLNKPWSTIMGLISDPNCKLKELHITCAKLTVKQFQQFYDSISEQSQLKIGIHTYFEGTADEIIRGMKELMDVLKTNSKGISVEYNMQYLDTNPDNFVLASNTMK